MKYLKHLLFLLVSVCTFATTQAQVSVRLGVGGRGRYHHGGRYYHHRAPVWHNHHRQYRYW